MKPIRAASFAIAASIGCALMPSHAAPPTVTPSPGYDARLQEQRKATSSFTTIDTPAPAPPAAKPVVRHRKRTPQQ